ncbi:MAG: glycosyltransferase family 2 protein [Bacteroidetes bacterium]|nr:glycosyltransferase family 2 protein [Bacteroidota bacterium]MBL0018692.1 glycosyltransferase family 2 protein [Bacteroidota bacterium]MBP6640098.1 glycosyltransferase family 2 protein [Bacteroidia bacterium]
MNPNILVIIPAFNEAESIGKVVGDIPKGLVREVVVVNNSSTDATETNAKAAGATVLRETRRGYGFACLCGIAYANAKQGAERPDIIVFIDGDYSDHPEQLPELLRPILEEGYDMVIGSRALGARERGSMTPQQVFGNWLATTLIRLFYRTRYTDLGPFRVIKMDKLLALEMKDQTYGWTVEMQLKAAKKKFKTTEVPVNYRRRIGVSKVSGTVKGTILAGYKILYTIFRYL